MTRVSVFHNIARDSAGRLINWFGYEPGHPLVKVFEADIDLAGPMAPRALAEQIWASCNLGPEDLTGRWAQFAGAYRARSLRSLSVGDVLLIDNDSDGETAGGERVALRADPVGFNPVPADELTIITAAEHGTQPWPADAHPLQI